MKKIGIYQIILSEQLTLITENIINAGIAESGIKGKAFYTPLRLALIGKMHGPELPSTFVIIGAEESVNRLKSYLLNNKE